MPGSDKKAAFQLSKLLCSIMFFSAFFVCSLHESIYSQSVYKRPQEVIDAAVIAESERALLEQDPPLEEVIRNLDSELQKYTSQFVENKLIADERRAGILNFRNMNSETARLISLYRKNKYDPTFYFGESPYLARIHRALGSAWEMANEKQKAVNSYMTSLRYASFESECRNEKPGEAEYISMAKSFSDPDRIAQSADSAEKTDAEEARGLIERYAGLKRRYEESVKNIDTARARFARGQPGESVAQAVQNSDLLRTEYEASVARLSEIYANSYLPFCTDRHKNTAQIVYRIARVSLEISEKADSEHRQNYADMLELAHSLDQNMPDYIEELILYYKNTGNKTRAIDLAEKSVKKLEAEKSEKLAENYFRLAGLYADTRNYILAADAYEKYLKAESDDAIKSKAYIPLADLHFFRTGNNARALSLYTAYLDAPDVPGKYPLDLMEKEIRYDAYVKTAAIYRKNQRTENETVSLEKAVETYRLLEGEKNKTDAEINELQIKINTLKKDLFDSDEESPLLREYYRLLRIDMPQLKEKEERYRIRLSAMLVESVLERLAVLSIYDRKFNRAVELYTEIIRRGRGHERDRARENIQKLQLTMQDGIYRHPALPPEFER